MSATDDHLAQRFSIAEAADRLGLTTHTLRYYETESLLLSPVSRTSAGRRRYAEADLRWIELVMRLRATGMPIREIRQYAELCRHGGGNETQRLCLLQAHRQRVLAQLNEVTGHLAAITTKIDGYTVATS